jgi:RND family efflux transporter MFP subunit
MKFWPAAVFLAWESLQAAVPVTTQSLGQVLEHPEFDAPATVTALNTPELKAEITARINRIAARVGDRLSKGELLVELDCRLYASRLAGAQSGLQELEARRRFAASQLARTRDLKAKRSVSDEAVEQRQSELDSLIAQQIGQRQVIRQAELDVEHCQIRSPFAAVVTQRLAHEGGLATSGTPVLRLVELDRAEVSADLRESELISLSDAAGSTFEYAGKRYPTRMRRVLPVVAERNRTRVVRLTFSAAGAPIGAAGRLIWRGRERLLPAEYLVRSAGRLGIFLLEQGAARFHPLPVAVAGRPTAVDLADDVRLIIEGRERLSDGEAVTEHSASEAAAS